MNGSLDETLAQFDQGDPATATYIAARRSGFEAVERSIVYEHRRLSASLRPRKGSVEREVQSHSLEWLRCALAHFQTNHGLFIPGDEGYPFDYRAVPALSRGEVSITFRAGTTALGTDEIRYLELRDGPVLKRVYRLHNRRSAYRVDSERSHGWARRPGPGPLPTTSSMLRSQPDRQYRRYAA